MLTLKHPLALDVDRCPIAVRQAPAKRSLPVPRPLPRTQAAPAAMAWTPALPLLLEGPK